jgi:hypothetical protein
MRALAWTLAVTLSACTGPAKARFEADQRNIKRGVAEKAVRERIEEYWEAVRWKDWSTAAQSLEDAEDQIRFLRTHSGDAGANIDSVEIQYVFVDPKAFDVAEVRVAWRQTLPSDGVLRPAQATHRWYKHHDQWWLSPDSLALAR